MPFQTKLDLPVHAAVSGETLSGREPTDVNRFGEPYPTPGYSIPIGAAPHLTPDQKKAIRALRDRLMPVDLEDPRAVAAFDLALSESDKDLRNRFHWIQVWRFLRRRLLQLLTGGEGSSLEAAVIRDFMARAEDNLAGFDVPIAPDPLQAGSQPPPDTTWRLKALPL